MFKCCPFCKENIPILTRCGHGSSILPHMSICPRNPSLPVLSNTSPPYDSMPSTCSLSSNSTSQCKLHKLHDIPVTSVATQVDSSNIIQQAYISSLQEIYQNDDTCVLGKFSFISCPLCTYVTDKHANDESFVPLMSEFFAHLLVRHHQTFFVSHK